PSMKIDKNYHCFACGVGGDAVDYVSRMFGLSQYDAALKLVEDFSLPIDVKCKTELSVQEKERIRRAKAEHERILHIQERFEKWCSQTVEVLKNCILEIDSAGHFLIGKPPDIVFSDDFAQMLHAEPLINYWLDILCMGEVSEKRELFLKDRKKVEEIAGEVCADRKRIMECCRGSA
ncbi:MAG: CHC2 zinc finger domain-containing protein, partial [Clostridium sp.]|nr:CHC2 zinc finger domain-containing protein [Clostridium sp.]